MNFFDGIIARRSVASFLGICFFLSSSQAQNRGKSDAASPRILVHSATVIDFGELATRVNAMQQASCNEPSRRFDHPITVEGFVGGKVKAIRVLHTAPQSSPVKSKQLRENLMRVWQGKFQSAACNILWDEGNFWSSESVVEFQDGRLGTLITDGVHVALQDHDGKNWFFRLLPAGQ